MKMQPSRFKWYKENKVYGADYKSWLDMTIKESRYYLNL